MEIISIYFPYRQIKQNLPKIMDFSKLFCRQHPTQLLTNYCTKQQCKIELCASCICIHTQSHLSQNSTPSYQNIRDMYRMLVDSVRGEIEVLRQIGKRVGHVWEEVRDKKDRIRGVVREARLEVVGVVDGWFQRMERELVVWVQGQDRMNGLHCQGRLQKLQKNCFQQIQNLMTTLHSISPTNFIQNLTKIPSQQLHNTKITSSQMLAEITENETYHTTASYNKNLLSNLGQVLESLVTVATVRGEKRDSTGGGGGSRVRLGNGTGNGWVDERVGKVGEVDLFTLRKLGSEKSVTSMGVSQKVCGQQEMPLTNVFQNLNTNKDSRVTVANRRMDRIMEIEETESIASSSTSGFNKDFKQSVLSQLPKNNYDFTFGNNLYNPKLPITTPQSPQSQSQVLPTFPQTSPPPKFPIIPSQPPTFQARQIGSSINKMSRKSTKNINQSEVSVYDQVGMKGDGRKGVMYRTQFL